MSDLVGQGRGRVRNFSRPSGDQPARPSFDPSGSAQPDLPVQSVIGFSHRGTNKPVVKSSAPFSSTKGDRRVQLIANYVKVRANHRILIYQYHVDFSIKVVNPETRAFLISSKAEMFNYAYIYDKQSTIMSTRLLPQEPFTYNYELNNRKTTKVTIRKVRIIAIDDEQMMHFFNAQLRMNMEKLDLVQILKNYYDFGNRTHIEEHRMEVIPGIVSTIKNCQDGILMGLDTIHKVVHLKTVLDVLNEMRNRNQTNYERELVGSIVITKYNNRTYRICGLERNKTPLEEFDKMGGEKINFIEYYQQNYNISIRNDKQPLLVAVSSNFEKKQKSKKLMLIPELCYITGLTPSMQNNFQLKRLLIGRTQLTPQERITRYNAFLAKINSNETILKELEKWQIGYGTELLKIEGTLLASEKVIVQEPVTFPQASADFTKEIRRKHMYRSCTLKTWHIVHLDCDKAVISGFLRHAKDLADEFGIVYQPPTMILALGDNSRAFLTSIGKIKESDLVMIVLPSNNKGMYDDIKRHLCCEVGLPSQCVLSKTLAKNNISISNKIMIQVAVKVGAEPWVLNFDSLSDDLMIVGFDVYRDKSKRRKSVGGFVASLNKTFSSWFSKVNFHNKIEEMSVQFPISVAAALRAYYVRNKKYPNKILIIRDGISEGQYKFTIETELRQLKEKASQIVPDIKITFMCINKRINTRFFRDEGVVNNPVSGTVVDTTITNANIPQFFLVSQSTTQGTVSPTSYDILEDNIRWPLVEYQRMVYKLCHLYYNWTGLISVPSACQYAHKLAYLAGGSFDGQFRDNLAEKLFFL